MEKYGYNQGDMRPDVKDYQRPESAFAENGFSKTTDYVGRKNKFEEREASTLRKQPYKGRYDY